MTLIYPADIWNDGIDPHDHAKKVADTHDCYVAAKGWLLRCCWCPEYVFAPTKTEAAKKMQTHYDLVCGEGRIIVGTRQRESDGAE